MAKETNNEPALLNLILEELQHSNQQLAAQNGNLQKLSEKINQPAKYDLPEKKLEELKNSIQQYHARLLQPTSSKIRHYYYVHTTTVIAVLFFIGLIALSWLCLDKSAEARMLKANGFKYRHLKLSGNLTLIRLLNATDSLYIHNQDEFKKNVEDRERNKKESTANFHR